MKKKLTEIYHFHFYFDWLIFFCSQTPLSPKKAKENQLISLIYFREKKGRRRKAKNPLSNPLHTSFTMMITMMMVVCVCMCVCLCVSNDISISNGRPCHWHNKHVAYIFVVNISKLIYCHFGSAKAVINFS